MNLKIGSASKIVQGHVLDVAKPALLAALRRYDPQLYIKWNPKKRAGQGCWELRRKPEFKSVKVGRFIDSPKGRYFLPGDVYEFDTFTLAVPKYNETSLENHVKDFDYLTYDMVSWVAAHDLWNYGFKGKDTMKEAEYREGQYLQKQEDKADEDRQYMIKDNKKAFREFGDYLLSGGNPYRLIDYWGK